MTLSRSFFLGAVAAIALIPLTPASAQASAEARWGAVSRCATIASDATRLACVDRVFREAGMGPSAEARSAERRRGFGLETAKPVPVQRPVPVAKPAPAAIAATAPRPAAKAAKAPAPPPERDDRVMVTLARVAEGGDRRLLLTTSEGAVWRQTESEPVRPMPEAGDMMEVRRTSLGGFMCKVGKYASFRCARRS